MRVFVYPEGEGEHRRLIVPSKRDHRAPIMLGGPDEEVVKAELAAVIAELRPEPVTETVPLS